MFEITSFFKKHALWFFPEVSENCATHSSYDTELETEKATQENQAALHHEQVKTCRPLADWRVSKTKKKKTIDV